MGNTGNLIDGGDTRKIEHTRNPKWVADSDQVRRGRSKRTDEDKLPHWRPHVPVYRNQLGSGLLSLHVD